MVNQSVSYKCDVCGYEGNDVVAGRWIFYCPAHKHIDWQKTRDNELPADNDFEGIDIDGQLADMIMENA